MSGRLACVLVALTLLAAAPARAGVSAGGTGAAVTNCAAGWTVAPFTGGSYQVTAGIVTKWFTQAGPGAGQEMRLVILRGTDPNYTVVGQSSVESIAASGLNSFQTRIPVALGDRLAVTTSGAGGPCMFASASDSVRYCIGCNSGPGTALNTTDLQQDDRVNVKAYVEQDADADGWGDESQDNCRGLANPDQANADGDGSGDACDVDDDNDSVADGDDAFPLDASESGDFDGDGIGDNADPDDDNDGVSDIDELLAGSDPRNAQSRPAGSLPAPVPAAAAGPVGTTPQPGSAPKLTIGAPQSIAASRFRRGLAVSATTDSKARLDLEVRVTPKGARLARFELLLVSSSLPPGSGRRTVQLKPVRGLPRSARRFTLQLRVIATGAAGERTVKTRTIKVR